MNEYAEKAVRYFSEGCDCERALIDAFEAESCTCADSPQSSEGIHTGSTLGRPQRICGIVAGAARIIEGKFCEGEDASKNTAAIQKAKKAFMERFLRENGSLLCKSLLGCDIRSYRGQFEAIEKGLCETECPKFIASAADILNEMMELP